MLAFFCLGARYRPWRYFAALHFRVFGDGAAPRRTRCLPQPRQHSVFRASGGETLSKSCLRRRFFAGRAAVIWCGASPGARPWQDFAAVRSRATGSGNTLARCVPKCLAVARFRRGAFPGGNPWQVLRSMHPKSGLGRENRQFAARFARHASEMSWFWQDMRAMHPKSPANRLSGTHGAKILPGRGAFRCTDPSNHACRANLAIRRRRSALAPATPVPPTSAKPPERPRPRHRRTVRAARARSPGPRNTAQEAAPPSPPGQQVPPTAPAVPPPLFANTSQ